MTPKMDNTRIITKIGAINLILSIQKRPPLNFSAPSLASSITFFEPQIQPDKMAYAMAPSGIIIFYTI